MTSESPELIDLFTAYTAHPDSIGRHLTAASGMQHAADPLLVATATDLALYPGDGGDPGVLGFRMSTRGFKELAAVSHLGPALASLVALRTAEPDGTWRDDAQRLLDRCRAARRANSTDLWQSTIAVAAYRGREAAIAAMIDHALDLTETFLQRALANPEHLSFERLRHEVLTEGLAAPVAFDRIMIATFFLIGMDISHRLIGWLDGMGIDWPRLMVVVAGKQGRPSAGVTWRTNSVASMILAAGRGRLPLERLLIAPHAPTFPSVDPRSGDLTAVRELEPALRELWTGTRAVSVLAGDMFPTAPAFAADPMSHIAVDPVNGTLSDLPTVSSPSDWANLVARLRLVMEDPRQLLSGAVSDYAARQLAAHGNDPGAITVPGLDGEPYPGLAVVPGQVG